MKKLATIFALAAYVLLASVSVNAQAFGAGNIVVYRVGGDANNGGGAAALTATATRVFLDEYTKAGVYVRTIALPDVVPTSPGPTTNRALTASGSQNFDGQITRSQDGRFITLTGYNKNPDVSNPINEASAVTNRIVGVIDAAGNVDTTAVIDNAFGNGESIRGAVTTGGTNGSLSFYAVGSNNGVRLARQGMATSEFSTMTVVTPTSAPLNIRAINIFGGQLFVSGASTATTNPLRAAAVGSGIPPADGTQPITNLPGIPNAGNLPSSATSFFFADLNPAVNFTINGFTTPVDTFYVVDDSSAGNGVLKFTFDGTNFVQTGSVALPRARGLTGFVTTPTSGIPTVTLFAVNVPVANGPSAISRIDDATGYNGTLAATPTTIVAASPTNTAFRGIALAPLVNPTADELVIEGRVTTAQGVPLAGVTMRLSGSEQAVTVTDADGHYSFSGIDVGGIYSVYAARRGYSFSPRVRTFGDVQTNTVADFVVAPPRKGRSSRFSR